MAQVTQLTAAQQTAMQNQQAMVANLQARQHVLSNAFDVKQQVDSQTFVPNARNTFDISGTNVGIVKGFTLKVTAKVTNNSATTMHITDFGIANLVKQITYYDPNNQRHIETSGWHVALVNTIKGQKPFGGATAFNGVGMNYDNHYPIMVAPSQLGAGQTGDIVMHYWIPLAYSDTDLTGAVFANVAQSRQRLRLEFANNNTAFVGEDENGLEAIYKGDGAADCTIDEISYTCYQHYLDQLPMHNGQYIVPSVDLSTIYLLENTVQAGLTANADFAVQYGNLYRYLSTIAIFDNGGEFNAGDDVNYLAQRTANFSDYRKASPDTWNLETRKLLSTDLPPAVYLAESRQRPIYTLQTGNQTFVINPKQVNQNARLVMAYESFVTSTNLVNIGTIATS